MDDACIDHAKPKRAGRLFAMTAECYAWFRNRPVLHPPVRERIWTVPGWRDCTRLQYQPARLAGCGAHQARRIPRRVDCGRVPHDGLAASAGIRCPEECHGMPEDLRDDVHREGRIHAHVHFHVVPRMGDFPDDRVGPGVFAYLRETPLAEHRRDEPAAKIMSVWPSD